MRIGFGWRIFTLYKYNGSNYSRRRGRRRQGCRTRGLEGHCPPDLVRSVNPMSSKGSDLPPPPPSVFSDLPTALRELGGERLRRKSGLCYCRRHPHLSDRHRAPKLVALYLVRNEVKYFLKSPILRCFLSKKIGGHRSQLNFSNGNWKIQNPGAVLELPARHRCQFSQFTSKIDQIGQIGQIGCAVQLVAK